MESKKSFQFIIGLTLVSLLLASCSNSFSLQGSLSIVLPAQQSTARSALNGIDCSKDDAASYDITLVSEGDGTTRTLSAKPGDSVAVSNLLPGMWTVTAKALNSSNACIGYGTMQTEVKQGQSTEADLSLSLNSSSSITSFEIKSEPSTTTYNLGDTFTLAGLEFEIAFSNGYSMTLGKDNLSLSLSDAAGATVTDGQTAITAADTEITIAAAFNNATFTFAIPLTIKSMTLTSISATMVDGSYAVLGHVPEQSCFVVTEVYSEASGDTTSNTTSCYTIAASSTEELGTVPVTITSTKDPSLSATVSNFTYKYETPSTPTVSISSTASTIPTIIGTATLSATASAGESYSLYENGTKTDTTVADTLSYQWYSVASDKTTSALDGGTESTYAAALLSADTTYECIVTATGNTAYCTSSSTETATATSTVSVTPWTLTLTDSTAGTTTSLSSGGTVALTAGDSYTMSFANANATSTEAGIANNTSYVSWALGTTDFTKIGTSSGWTFTAPTATTSEQSSTFTATITYNSTSYTLGYFTATVAASTSITSGDDTSSSTSITSFSALKTAIESVTASSSGSFEIATTFTTATTDTTTITVNGNITLTAPSGSTSTITRTTAQVSIPLFTVSSTGSLTLGGSGGSLVIDGGGASTTAVAAAASLISVTSGTVTVGTGATLTNNVFSSSSTTNTSGGAIYASAGTINISGGTISNNDVSQYADSSRTGGAIYMTNGGSFTMTSGTISGNKSYATGGALYIAGTSSSSTASLTISGGTFSSNKSGTSGSIQNKSGGGAIFAYNTVLNISGSSTSFESNSTDYAGGAFYLSSGVTGTIAECTIDSNTAYTKAGGIYAAGNSSITTSCTISKNTVTAGLGGGMQIDDSSSVTMNGGSITGNTASTGGGGVYISLSSSSFTLKSGTISSNTYTLSTSGFGNNVYLNAGTYIYYSSGAATTVTTKTSYDDTQTGS